VFMIHALGDIISPPLVGTISDRSSLGSAMLILPVAAAIAGGIWIWGALQEA